MNQTNRNKNQNHYYISFHLKAQRECNNTAIFRNIRKTIFETECMPHDTSHRLLDLGSYVLCTWFLDAFSITATKNPNALLSNGTFHGATFPYVTFHCAILPYVTFHCANLPYALIQFSSLYMFKLITIITRRCVPSD